MDAQLEYDKVKKRINAQINFVDVDPVEMDENQRRVFDKNLVAIDCGNEDDNGFRVMALYK